jgi:hypothetical protein
MRCLLPILLACASPSLALAHATQLADGLDVQVWGDRALIETTVGLLVADAPGLAPEGWRWICHEALSASDSAAIPRYELVPGGILGAIFTLGEDAWVPGASVYRTEDGCTWTAPEGLQDRLVGDLSVRDDGAVLAVTASLSSPNAALLSTDGGASFAATSLQGDARVLNSVRWGADGRAWIGAAQLSPYEAWLLTTDDDGETWTERLLPTGPEAETPFVVAAHPLDPDRLWLRMDGFTEDRLLATEDGGESWAVALVVEGDILDVTLLPDGAPLVVTDAGAVLRDDGAGLQPVPGLPLIRATGGATDALLYVANAVQEPWLLGRDDGAGGIDRLLTLQDLTGPLECPTGTRTQASCAVPWETVARVLGIWEGDVVDEPDLPPQVERPGACGGSAALLPLLLPLLWLGPRRRAHQTR